MMIEKIAGKSFAAAFSAAMVGAVLWPVVQNWRKEPKDSFPLSYYPMFSLKRQGATTVRYLVGIDASGERHLLPHTFAGTGGLNQVRRQINKIVRGGKADTLCRLVAAKVARADDESFAGVVTVQVVNGRFRLTEYFTGERGSRGSGSRGSIWDRMEASRTREDRIEASCPVERGRQAHLRVVEDPA